MASRQLQIPIENPTLELKIVSASNISHINATDKVDVYAVVSIDGDTTQKKQSAKTPIDYDGGSDPTWNHTVKFSVNEREANEGLLTIKVKLYSYWLENENDLYMGEVNVSVEELLVSNPLPPFANGNVNKMKSVTYPVKLTGESKPNSKLSLSYRFKSVLVDDLYPPAQDYSPSFGQHVYPNPDPARSSQPLLFPPPQFQTATGKLILDLVIKSANDIKDVNTFSAMDVYASAVILKDKQVKQRINTPVALSAYKYPKWNHEIEFFLEEVFAQEGRLTLGIELFSHRPLLGDKDIGKVNFPIQELLASNPPSHLTNGIKLEKDAALTGPYGTKGTVRFAYRFLTEQATVPPPSTTLPQPYIMYLPVSHQSYASASDYMTVQPSANLGPNNGLVPIYMPPSYQSHGNQQPLPTTAQHSQLQSLPQQRPHRPPTGTHLYQPYSSLQPLPEQKPQAPPPQEPTHSDTHTQGGGVTALGLGASVLGRVVGQALISDMMSDEVNIYI